jgi:hypothetical protein
MNCDLLQKKGGRYGACPHLPQGRHQARRRSRHPRQAAFEDEFYLCKQHPDTGKWEPTRR